MCSIGFFTSFLIGNTSLNCNCEKPTINVMFKSRLKYLSLLVKDNLSLNMFNTLEVT